MTLLSVRDNNFYITKSKPFEAKTIAVENSETCFEFAYQMAFGEGYHRKHRSGGQRDRRNGELFGNTFQGKLAEFVTCNTLKKRGLKEIVLPDTSVCERGIWDDADLEYRGKKISIKSCVFFSNLLLLEQKDWNEKGQYIPNIGKDSCQNYDYFLLVRIKPDVKALLKKQKLFFSKDIDKSELKDIVFNEVWYYDFAGFCTQKTIQYIIDKKYILPQNAFLNGKTKMDADNYYIQSGDLKNIDELIAELKKL